MKGYIRKGYALMAMKELSKAQSAFQKALEIDENNKACLFIYLHFIYTNDDTFLFCRKLLMVSESVL